MTLAQEKPFKSGHPYKARLAYDIPSRNPARAKEAIVKLRQQYNKMSPDEQRMTVELLQEGWRVLVQMTKNKREFSSAERKKIWEVALMYSALKSEFNRGKRK
jgi:hypothetical protein